MNLMTFSTFLVIALEGFIFGTNYLRRKNHIPIRAYLKVVIVSFAVSVINNQALNFNVPVPLHIIFRSRYSDVAEASFDFRLLTGVAMLIFALVFSSFLGIFQEQLYERYGKHPREAMFYVVMIVLFVSRLFVNLLFAQLSENLRHSIPRYIFRHKWWFFLIHSGLPFLIG
ncbi:unnamed protein product [Soboliphyme baturini]|uniref:MBOAT family protein n=1 Tax=Soboliphyme baturini TaxID=241478 RepID=A0A183I9V3_9BILA|nr:unnamed protein product [Soboliphyme baturini]